MGPPERARTELSAHCMRALTLVSLLIVACGMALAAWWMSSSNGEAPQAPTALPGAPPPAGSSEPSRAAGAPPTDEGDATARRIEAPRDPQEASGHVVDGEGQPVAGATVACWRKGGELTNEAVTDASGAFRVEIPPGRERLRLEVKARGHLPRRVTHAVPDDGRDVAVGEVRLRPGAMLAGRVIGAGGGPVAGASVYRLEPTTQAVQRRNFERIAREQNLGGEVTDADGRFEIEHTRPGDFSLLVGHPDYPVAWLHGRSVPAGGAIDDLVVILRRGSSIRGRVVGLEQSRGAVVVLAWSLANRGVVPEKVIEAQAQVAGLDNVDPFATLPDVRRIELDKEGHFALSALRPDERFAIWALERDPVLVRAWRCSQQMQVSAGDVGVVLHYEPGTTVTLRVVDAETDEPITRLLVTPRLRTSGGLFGVLGGHSLVRPTTLTHEGGRVTISGIRVRGEKTMALHIRARGYQKYRSNDIAVPAAGTLDLGTLRLTPKK